MFADAVCSAGWRLNSAAAKAVVLSLVLSACGSPELGLQAHMWAYASILAHPVNNMRAEGVDKEPIVRTVWDVVHKGLAALVSSLNDGAAAGMPALLQHVTR